MASSLIVAFLVGLILFLIAVGLFIWEIRWIKNMDIRSMNGWHLTVYLFYYAALNLGQIVFGLFGTALMIVATQMQFF